MRKLVEKVRCKKALDNACDGHNLNCPHYHLHTRTSKCEPSVCSRITSSSDRVIHCELIEKVFVKSKPTKKKRRVRKKKVNVKTPSERPTIKINRDGGKNGKRKNKRIKLVRKRT